MTPPVFFAAMAKAGFRFHRMSANNIARETAGTTQDQLEAWSALVDASTSPPGPIDAMLGEIIVHSETSAARSA